MSRLLLPHISSMTCGEGPDRQTEDKNLASRRRPSLLLFIFIISYWDGSKYSFAQKYIWFDINKIEQKA